MRFALGLLFTSVLLCACGGNDASETTPPEANQLALEEYNRRVIAANDAATAVKVAVPTGPCSDSPQCGTLVLNPPARCGFTERIAYSLVSPSSAAASAAAANQRLLAQHAASAQPLDNISCTITERVQVPVCVANQCQF